MKSIPGSERAMPVHGQVKLVPSMRNWFSLVPEPNAEMVVTVPLAGDVGEMPGIDLMASNMLVRLDGIVLRSWDPKREAKPGFLVSMRDPDPSTTTDSATPARLSITVRSIVVLTPMGMAVSCHGANPSSSTSNEYDPGGSTGK